MWSELNTPDDFRRDWYGELTNQCGHTLGGVLCAAFVAFGWLYAFGEFPPKVHIIAACALPYTVLIEWWVQGWRSGDSWFDAAMWIFGALGPCLALSEVVVDGVVYLAPHPERVAVVVVAWAVFLGARVLKRYAASTVT